MEKQYILFLDNISRTVMATLVEDSPNALVVVNPVVLQITNDQSQKLRMQLIPLLLRDLHKDPDENVQWTYNPSQVTRASFSGLNDRLVKQYEFVTSLTPDKAAELNAKASVTSEPAVKLFDEKK